MKSSEKIQNLTTAKELPTDLSWWKDGSFLNDYYFRREFVKNFGFKGFCLIYLSHYVQLPPADFHPELLKVLQDPTERMIEIIGFRGSAKSTFGSLALPIYAAVEEPERYPFILPVADTTLQAGINISNIKSELENNVLIRQDYGDFNFEKLNDPNPEPTLESDEEWQAKNMLLSTGVRILARSRGQKVRGLRHRQHRPKLVIVDDPEDLEWVHTKENRDKTERWLRGEVIPAIDERDGRLILIGNHLHNDALMARMKASGLFRVLEFPLVLPDGTVTWKGKYPTPESIEEQKKKAGSTAWQREYQLKAIPEEGQEVTEEDIRYYNEEPAGLQIALKATGIDLAISKKQTADFTSMVSGTLGVIEGNKRMYINPYPINSRLGFKETIDQAKALHMAIAELHQFFVEAVSYQKAAIEEFERALLPVVGMQPINDKRARLKVAATYIKNGTVVFPRKGCEDLLIQLLGFGVEEHDDLVDALGYLILGLVNQGLSNPEVVLL